MTILNNITAAIVLTSAGFSSAFAQSAEADFMPSDEIMVRLDGQRALGNPGSLPPLMVAEMENSDLEGTDVLLPALEGQEPTFFLLNRTRAMNAKKSAF